MNLRRLNLFIGLSLLLSCNSDIQVTGDNIGVNRDQASPVIPEVCNEEAIASLPYASGSGSSTDPYIICTADQFNNIGLTDTDWDKYFTQAANIDLIDYDGLSAGTTITPIGSYDTNLLTGSAFTGSFDGGSFTISNFTYPNDVLNADLSAGLFGYTLNAVIKNIKMSTVSIAANDQLSAACLIGYAESTSISGIRILSCTINGKGSTGGVVGHMLTGSITKSSSNVSMSGGIYKDIGGIVGLLNAGEITTSFSSGNISSSGSQAGGIIGHIQNATNIENCYSTLSISGTGSLGGIYGEGWDSSGSISNVYATGNISSSNVALGGIGGQTGPVTISNAYYLGNIVLAGVLTGGIGGNLFGVPTITNSFFIDTDFGGASASAQIAREGATGVTGGSPARAWNNSAWKVFDPVTGNPKLAWEE